MRHFSIVRVVAAATSVLILLSVNTSAQSTNSVEEFVKMINGTWILKVRINPNGSEHAQPLQGYTTFALKMNKPDPIATKNKGTAVGGRVSARNSAIAEEMGATGTIQGEEYGVMDLQSSHLEGDIIYASTVGKEGTTTTGAAKTGTATTSATQTAAATEVAYEPFRISITGTVEIRTMSEDSEGSTISLRYPDSLVKGTYGVFKGEGISTPGLESVYRFNAPRRITVDGREVITGGAISLINEPRMNLSDSQRGQAGGPGDASHTVKSHVIHQDIMEIVYGNGTKDIWVRESSSAMSPTTVKTTLQNRSKLRLRNK